MALFKKKADPISERARVLNAEIAALEAKIKKLDTRLQHDHEHPRLRSTALPHGNTISHATESSARMIDPATPVVHEPIFEEVDQNRLRVRGRVRVEAESIACDVVKALAQALGDDALAQNGVDIPSDRTRLHGSDLPVL